MSADSADGANLEVPAPTGPAPTPSPGKPGRKRGPKLRTEERAVRAEMVLARKLQGNRIDEIAAEFHISRATTYRALSQARRDGLYEQAKDFLHARLLPKALAVYDQALDEMNVEVARDVLNGLGVTGRNVNVNVKHEVKEDFDAWRLAKTKALDAVVTEIKDATDPAASQERLEGASLDVPGEGAGGDGQHAVAPDPPPAEPEDGE